MKNIDGRMRECDRSDVGDECDQDGEISEQDRTGNSQEQSVVRKG